MSDVPDEALPGCLSLTIVAFVAIFGGIWAVSAWLNPVLRDWCHALPLNIGFLIFVLGGLIVAVLPGLVAVMVFAALTSEGADHG